jgi:hypothetical protein
VAAWRGTSKLNSSQGHPANLQTPVVCDDLQIVALFPNTMQNSGT